MNILQILPMMDVGGVETGVLDLSRELVKRGHSVTVVSNGGHMVKDLINAGVRHIKLPVHKKSFFTILRMSKRIGYIVREEHIDIVHARSRVPAIISFFATRSSNVSFITTAHGYYSRHALSSIMGWGKFVIVASSIIGRHMMEDFRVPRERIRFIPRGVDLDKFSFKLPDPSRHKTEYRIGIVGRITPIKGHSFLLQAMARIVRIIPNVKLIIVGEAPREKPEYKEALEALIRKLDIERFVEFLGARHDIANVMSKLDLLVLPSVGQEAFGRVIIEAGASGVPVIATRIGGAVDIIEHERTGLLVKPGDIMEMIDSVVRLLKDRQLARDLAKEARRKIEKEYSLRRMVEGTLKIYEEAKAKKRILVIKIGALGDVILAVPSLRAIRQNLPAAYISVMVGSEARQALKRCPYIDDIIIYERKNNHKGILGYIKMGSIVRQKAFDISIDLQNNNASHIIAWLGAIPQRFGYNTRKFGFLINNRLRYLNIKSGPVDEQFRVLQRAGISTIGTSKRLEIWPDERDFLYIGNLMRNEWVREGQILIGLNIGGSWDTKRWPLKYFAKLADALASRDIRVVITGSKKEQNLADEFLRLTKTRVINTVGMTNIFQLAALIKRCAVYVTSDSAPMHIASSVGTDFIALFGPTDPHRHFEPDDKGMVIQKEVGCGPCYKSECRKIRCMEKISVAEIYNLIMAKISKTTNRLVEG